MKRYGIGMLAEQPKQSVTDQVEQPRIFLLRHLILLGVVVLLLAVFAYWMSDRGQMILRGTSPPGETPFQADDREMGAGLAPFVFALFPALLVCFGTTTDIIIRYVRRLKHQKGSVA